MRETYGNPDSLLGIIDSQAGSNPMVGIAKVDRVATCKESQTRRVPISISRMLLATESRWATEFTSTVGIGTT